MPRISVERSSDGYDQGRGRRRKRRPMKWLACVRALVTTTERFTDAYAYRRRRICKRGHVWGKTMQTFIAGDIHYCILTKFLEIRLVKNNTAVLIYTR